MFPKFSRLCRLSDKVLWFNDHLGLVKRCLSHVQSSIQSEQVHHAETFNEKSFPSSVMKRTVNVNSLRLFDKSTAKEFTSLIREDLMEDIDKTFVIEMNPGIGLITEELLNAGVPVLHSYESIPEFMNHLQPLKQKYQNRLDIRDKDFLKVSKVEYIDRMTNSRKLLTFLEGIEKKKWNCEPAIKVVGAVPKMTFFYFLQCSLISQSLSDVGRMILYVAISPSMAMAFEDCPQTAYYHRAKNIFLRTLFDCKFLGSVPREAFHPKETPKIRKRNAKFHIHDSEFLHVVKIETKLDFFSENFTRRDAVMFFHFLSFHLRKRRTRIIPALEKWVPGCGLRLIKKDLNIYTEFSELNSQELLNLFMEFKSWPEYETCPFIGFVDSTLQSKMVVRK